MAEYAFVTHWRLEAPVEAVWEAISRSEDWPTWWRGVRRVEVLRSGDDQGLGELRRYEWRSVLPYSLLFDARTVKVERPHLLEAETHGELVGMGRWVLEQQGNVADVHYFWNVRTTRPWMNLLAPVLRPAFNWNHDVIMRWGAAGLAQHLGARLLPAT